MLFSYCNVEGWHNLYNFLGRLREYATYMFDQVKHVELVSYYEFETIWSKTSIKVLYDCDLSSKQEHFTSHWIGLEKKFSRLKSKKLFVL